jgi:hypothetical protein
MTPTLDRGSSRVPACRTNRPALIHRKWSLRCFPVRDGPGEARGDIGDRMDGGGWARGCVSRRRTQGRGKKEDQGRTQSFFTSPPTRPRVAHLPHTHTSVHQYRNQGRDTIVFPPLRPRFIIFGDAYDSLRGIRRRDKHYLAAAAAAAAALLAPLAWSPRSRCRPPEETTLLLAERVSRSAFCVLSHAV